MLAYRPWNTVMTWWKAVAFVDQYESVFTKEGTSNMRNMGTSPYPSNVDIVVTTKGVTKLFKALNPKKAVGPDMIPTTVLGDHA